MLVVVRVGKDGISSIMEGYGISRTRLSELNDVSLQDIQEGMFVITEISEIVHVVKPFETIESIATLYGVTPTSIRQCNGIDKVHLGDRLYIDRE